MSSLPATYQPHTTPPSDPFRKIAGHRARAWPRLEVPLSPPAPTLAPAGPPGAEPQHHIQDTTHGDSIQGLAEAQADSTRCARMSGKGEV